MTDTEEIPKRQCQGCKEVVPSDELLQVSGAPFGPESWWHDYCYNKMEERMRIKNAARKLAERLTYEEQHWKKPLSPSLAKLVRDLWASAQKQGRSLVIEQVPMGGHGVGIKFIVRNGTGSIQYELEPYKDDLAGRGWELVVEDDEDQESPEADSP